MTSLTPEDRLYIDAKPLPTDVHTFVSDSTRDEEGTNAKDDISDLLAILQNHPVARRLRSAYRPVNGELALIYAGLQSDDYDLSPFKPLTTLITNNASDAEIWQAVLDLILTLSRSSPKPLKSIPLSFNGTPRTYSSASFRDSVQKRKELEEPMRHELASCTYINVREFFDKYFKNRSWSKSFDRLQTRVMKDAALHSFPNTAQPEEKEVWKWLDDFQKKYLTEAPGVYYQAKSYAAIIDAQGQRQLDIFLKHRSAPLEEPHSARDIRAIGELTKSPKKDAWRKKYLQIATYVRDVFAAQPTRWFVHGFLIFGSQMELWVFDRSGAYGSELFDVREHPKRFIRIIAGYAMMSNGELGLSPIIKHHKSGISVTVTDAITGKDLDLQLEATPIVSQPAIVSRGTTCYRTLDEKNVVKMSWRPDKPHSEADLLTIAQGVKGIPRLVGSCNVTTIEELRSNLDIKIRRQLGPEYPPRSTASPALSFTSQSTHAMAKLDMSGTKRGSDSTDEPLSKRPRSSQTPNLRKEVKPSSIGSKTPKQSFIQAQSSSPERSSYRNRVLTCLAIAPAGRPLQYFHTILEVLHAFRDAIKAHRSLFLERNILHRDISINNIILTDAAQNDGCSGMLIDLDLAVLVGKDGKNETSEQKTMTGTLEYMAIQVLANATKPETAGIEHTYRHDLESFFYVFLSLCVRYGWPNGQKDSSDKLKAWYIGAPDEIARIKRGDMEAGGFEDTILPEFSPLFNSQKELAKRLRGILFGAGALNLETPEKPASLYNPMIEAFDAAIREIKCRKRGLRSRLALKEISCNENAARPERSLPGEKNLNGNGRKRKATTTKIQTKRRRCG